MCLLLDINPTVSRSTNASFIPSPEGSASPLSELSFAECEDLKFLFYRK